MDEVSNVLDLRHIFSLLQICVCTEDLIHIRGNDQNSYGTTPTFLLDIIDMAAKIVAVPPREGIAVTR